MANITVTSTTYSYVIFKNFVLKPKETSVLSTDDFVLSEYKSLNNLIEGVVDTEMYGNFSPLEDNWNKTLTKYGLILYEEVG